MVDFDHPDWSIGKIIWPIMQRFGFKGNLITPRDFAFTGTTWSQVAENEVKKRYRFGRLWVIGSHYDTPNGRIRFADLVGVLGADELDGGPPSAARYITRQSQPYRLPAMELECLIYEYDAFRNYLRGALEDCE
jgi:hypothetical protein